MQDGQMPRARPRRVPPARHRVQGRDIRRVRGAEDAIELNAQLDKALDGRLAVAHADRDLAHQDLACQELEVVETAFRVRRPVALNAKRRARQPPVERRKRLGKDHAPLMTTCGLSRLREARIRGLG
jgi:hypothetical protein